MYLTAFVSNFCPAIPGVILTTEESISQHDKHSNMIGSNKK